MTPRPSARPAPYAALAGVLVLRWLGTPGPQDRTEQDHNAKEKPNHG